MKLNKGRFLFALFAIGISLVSTNSYARIFPVLDVDGGTGKLRDASTCDTAPAGSFRANICQGKDGGGNYTGNVCQAGPSNTVNFGIKGVVAYFPAHEQLSVPIVIPDDCQSDKVVLDGTDCTAGSFNADGSCKTPQLDTREIVIDGRNIPADRCAFEINTTKAVVIKNFTFVNLQTGAGAICINNPAANVTIINNHIGTRRMSALVDNGLGFPAETDPLILNPLTNTNGIVINANNVKVQQNLIQNNTLAGIIVQENATNTEIGDGTDANKNTIVGNKHGGVVFVGSTTSSGKGNVLSFNSIHDNAGLGVDLVHLGVVNLKVDSTDGVTLHADNVTTLNDSVNLAEDVIIAPIIPTPPAGQPNYTFSANSFARNITNLTVEIYTPSNTDATDNLQKRDGRSYGEGQFFVQKILNVKTSDDITGHFSVPFVGNPETLYSAILTIPTRGTSEFSAVVKTGKSNIPNPVCEGQDNGGTGVPAPNAPTGLTAGRSATDNSVTISFSDNSTDESGFRVERAPGVADCSKATNYVDISSTLTPPSNTSHAGLTATFVDKNAPATALCYRATAYRTIDGDNTKHLLNSCDSTSSAASARDSQTPPPTNQPPVIIVYPNPTQPNDPVTGTVTDKTVDEDAFCIERADKACKDAQDGDFKQLPDPYGVVKTPNKPGTGETVPFTDPTAQPGHLYCYRAKPQINGNCVASLVSNKADAEKLKPDGSTVVPQDLVAEGSGGCSISNTASHFNFLSLIALLAIAPVALTRAFRFRKV